MFPRWRLKSAWNEPSAEGRVPEKKDEGEPGRKMDVTLPKLQLIPAQGPLAEHGSEPAAHEPSTTGLRGTQLLLRTDMAARSEGFVYARVATGRSANKRRAKAGALQGGEPAPFIGAETRPTRTACHAKRRIG